MAQVVFEDVHKHEGDVYYLYPNEHVGIWSDMVQPLKIERAAGICSAGEVGFFSILPAIKQELVLVDHSYRSLCVAMLKYLVLRELGASKARELFASADTEKIKAELTRAAEHLPPALTDAYQRVVNKGDAYTTFTNQTSARMLAGEWKAAPATTVQKACGKLDKVVFLHGDLTDLAARGPFDLLYLSNALEHTSRTKRRPIAGEVAKAVKPGGYALAAGKFKDAFSVSTHPEGWEVVQAIKCNPGDYNKIAWDHVLYRLPEAA